MITRCTLSVAYRQQLEAIPAFLLPSFHQFPAKPYSRIAISPPSATANLSRKGKEKEGAVIGKEVVSEDEAATARLGQGGRTTSWPASSNPFSKGGPFASTSTHRFTDFRQLGQRAYATAAMSLNRFAAEEVEEEGAREWEAQPRHANRTAPAASDSHPIPPPSSQHFTLLSPEPPNSPSWHLSENPSRKDIINLIRTPLDSPLTTQRLHHLRKSIVSAKKNDDVIVIAAYIRLAITSSNEWAIHRLAIQFLTDCTPRILERHDGQISPGLVQLYESTTKLLTEKEAWPFVFIVARVGTRRGIVTAALLRARGRSCYEMKRFAEGIHTFSQYEKYGLKPDGPAYDDVVGSCLFSGKVDQAQEMLAKKEAEGFETTSQTILTLLDGMFRYGGNPALEEQVLRNAKRGDLVWRQAPRQDVKVLNRIMSVRAARGDLVGALQVLSYFDLSKLPTPLRLPTDAPPPVIAETTNPRFNQYRPAPNIATFATLIGICIRTTRFDCSVALFALSQQIGVGLNEYLVAALLRALIVNDQLDDAVALVFRLIKGEGSLPVPASTSDSPATLLHLPVFQPTALVCDVLLSGILDLRGLKGGIQLLNEMSRSNFLANSPDAAAGLINAFTTHLVKRGSTNPTVVAIQRKVTWRLIARARGLLQGKRAHATIRGLKALVTLAWKQEQIVSERSALYKLKSSQSASGKSATDKDRPAMASTPNQHPLASDFHHHLHTIRALVTFGKLAEAHHSIERLKQAGVPLHPAYYTVLIAGCARRRRFDLARRAYRELLSEGIIPDLALYRVLAITSSRAGDLKNVEAVWQEAMKNLPGLTPLDPSFVSVSYRTQVATGDVLGAQTYMWTKLKEGLEPDSALLGVLDRVQRLIRRKLNNPARSMRKTQSRVKLIEALELGKRNMQALRSKDGIETNRMQMVSEVKRRVLGTLARRRALRKMKIL